MPKDAEAESLVFFARHGLTLDDTMSSTRSANAIRVNYVTSNWSETAKRCWATAER